MSSAKRNPSFDRLKKQTRDNECLRKNITRCLADKNSKKTGERASQFSNRFRGRIRKPTVQRFLETLK